MTLKSAIIAALPSFSIVDMAEAVWPGWPGDAPDLDASAPVNVASMRRRLQRSPRVSLEYALTMLNKQALVTVCRVVGLKHSGRRDELVDRLIALDDFSRRFRRTSRPARAARRQSTPPAPPTPASTPPPSNADESR